MSIGDTNGIAGEVVEAYQELEERIGEWAGVDNVVACSSGTAALHLALEAYRFPPGSPVLVPDYTMIACTRAVTLAGLDPVFIDCDDNLLMDLDLVDECLSDRIWPESTHPVAVMPVHIYGRRVNMESLSLLAVKYGIKVVEDMAELHAIRPHQGTDAACWSFYKNKIIAGEEGGAVAFKDEEQAARARSLRSLGMMEKHDFYHTPRGHNYRMSNVHARLIIGSLKDVNWEIRARNSLVESYDQHCPEEWRMPRRLSPWVYDLRIKGMTAEQQTKVVLDLNKKGIAARHGFKPMSRQEEYRSCLTYVGKGGSNAERLSTEVIYLPLGAEVAYPDKVFELIRRALGS